MAELLERLNQDIIKLTYEGGTVKKDVLKGLKCQIQLAQKKSGKDLTNEQEIDILKKEIKQKQISAEEFSYKEEFANKLKVEIEILSQYLPQYISEEETEILVLQVLAENQISTKRDFKKATELTIAGRNDIDKSVVSKILQKKLV